MDDLCGGQISSGSTRRQKGLARGFGLVISRGNPFVAHSWRNGPTWERSRFGPERPVMLGRYLLHSPDFPARSAPEYRNRLEISRLDYS
jgi:hypothetical protein